ncbi:MAG: CarD family transcriptional regulator [Chloroflexota bacterium]|nr:CarD family transcriptional regulator [Chloroflexota bacterium]
MSSKAPSKSKTSAKEQTSAKARKRSSPSPSTVARTKASARTRTAAKKTAGTASSARRAAARTEAKQSEVQEGDTVKPEGAAGRAKSAKAAKAGKSTKPAKEPKAKGGPRAKRVTKASDASTSSATAEARRKKKVPTEINGFSVGDYVVYPAHGVGRITGIDERAVADQTLQMFVVAFEKDKMTLMVPTDKVESAGMRRLSSKETMDAAITTLRGRARQRRVMWSRRAQEYEAKLNSGNPVSIAEVVRDLHRNVGQPDQSYSERQMYEAALDRLAREFAAVDNTDTEQAANKLEDVLRAA